MAKNSITDYSKTASLNTDIQSVDIDEGCLPSGINNAIREIMADLADMNDGTVTLTSPSFAAASLTGDLSFGDGNKAIFGDNANGDLVIQHDGTDSKIVDRGTGELLIQGSSSIRLQNFTGTQDYFVGVNNGASTIYHSGSAKLATTATGIDITGNATFDDNGRAIFGAGSDLQIYHDGANTSYISTSTGNMVIQDTDGGTVFIRGKSGENSIIANDDNSVRIFFDNAEKLATTSTGVNVTGGITTSDNITMTKTNGAVTIQDETNNNKKGQIQQIAGRLILRSRNDASNGNITFEGHNSQEYARFNASGYLGLGTSSPSAALDFGSSFYNGTPSTLGQLINKVALYADGSGPAYGLGISDGALNITAGANGDIRLHTNGVNERLRIDSSGNVGIGTSSPNANVGFSIGSDIKISQVAGAAHQSGNAGSIGLTISDGGNHSGVFVNNSHDGTYSDQFITFNTAEGGVSASTERMRIDSSGNVGIGDTAPVTPLTIATTNKLGSTFTGTTNGEGLTVTQTNYTAGNYISLVEAAYDDSNDANPNVRIGAMFDGNGSNLAFGTSNGYGSGITNTAMFINSSGRVGIGTSSPSAPLHVVGNSYVQSGTFYTDAITAFSGSSININAGSSHLSATVNGSERMRIDSSGNVLVGKTSDNFGTAGCEARPEGSLRITRDNSTAGFFNRLNSDGTIVNFYKDSSSVGSIGTATSEAGKFRIAGTDSGLQFRTTDIVPTNGAGNLSDNTKDMGDASARFDDIFATNGTIQTSDQNEKQDIEALSEAEQRVAVAAKGLLRKFRWIDSVEEKGDDARIHFGIIAQDLQAAFEAEGLDAGRYAMFINSTWTDEETGEERSRMGVRYNQLLAFIIAAI
jgi:hypothetical protein